jgi:hypothetical protein
VFNTRSCDGLDGILRHSVLDTSAHSQNEGGCESVQKPGSENARHQWALPAAWALGRSASLVEWDPGAWAGAIESSFGSRVGSSFVFLVSNGTGHPLALQSQDIVDRPETSQWYLARVGVGDPTTISLR